MTKTRNYLNIDKKCSLTCVPYVASFSVLSFFLLPLQFSLMFICKVSIQCLLHAALQGSVAIYRKTFSKIER